ncbi:hypothetical protein EDWATA_02236 [Edwardsiella tarda ATCC 23685]|uniref:Uncharacterized protein n=1 Tax=Edwardsiella tarda ATCC 23685 TaxID=500638 RepID=D4F656_EDWTA|nr:hypothetical protein EDWATA_02236 [Edwardsiella tarda ATCC 23685]
MLPALGVCKTLVKAAIMAKVTRQDINIKSDQYSILSRLYLDSQLMRVS